MTIFSRGARGAGVLRWSAALLALGALSFVACLVGALVVDGMATAVAPDDRVREVRRVLRDVSFAGFASLVVGIVILIPGELRRRGRWQTHNRSLVQGGINSIEFTPLSLRVHWVWFVVITVIMLGTTVLPLSVAGAGGWPAALDYAAAGDTWHFLSLFGSLARIAWVMIGLGLLKKVVASRHPVEGVVPSRVWRWIAYRWRADVALGFIAGIAVNVAFVEAIDGGGVQAAAIAGALILVAALIAANYWRAAKPLGSIESVA